MKKVFDWAVIGAGPAGINAVGQLIEHGINANNIIWIDPNFKVGDFAAYWQNVSSNTTVQLFCDFLKHLKAFDYESHPKFKLYDLPKQDTCQLSFMVEPLNWITKHLQAQINSVVGMVEKLNLFNRAWHLKLHDGNVLQAKNAIMATGAIPKVLTPPDHVETISLYDALDPEKLKKHVTKDDEVAVFGSSHSAVILIRDLLDSGVKKVINFYLEPLRFALKLDGWILFDNTGLKGNAAKWAREYLDGKLPDRLERVYSSTENVAERLPLCSKVIYAVGFEKRAPIIEGYPTWQYNSSNGIVAPGLFAVGIGFPEQRTDPYGNVELSVGLWKFMQYLDKVVPLWLKYST